MFYNVQTTNLTSVGNIRRDIQQIVPNSKRHQIQYLVYSNQIACNLVRKGLSIIRCPNWVIDRMNGCFYLIDMF